MKTTTTKPTLAAEIMKEVKRYDDGMGCTRQQLVDSILILIDQYTNFDNVPCECGDRFGKHQKPPTGVPWDICSFPCSECECQEFNAAATTDTDKTERG